MKILDRYPTAEKPAHFDSTRLQMDETKVFPPIVTEAEDLIGYLRTGGCTVGCGACCTAFVVPIKAEGLEDDDFTPVVHGQIILPVDPVVRGKAGFADWEYWLRLHGVYLFQMPSGLLTAAVPAQAEEPPGVMTFDGWVTWLGLPPRGITVLRRFGQALLAYVPIRCSKLAEDGTCGVFNTSERPKMCAPYPEHPLDVQGLDFCTYKFQPIKRDQLLTKRSAPSRKKKGKRKKKR